MRRIRRAGSVYAVVAKAFRNKNGSWLVRRARKRSEVASRRTKPPKRTEAKAEAKAEAKLEAKAEAPGSSSKRPI